jgi:hypothetical protein
MVIYSNKAGIILVLLWLNTVRQCAVMTTGMMAILKSRDLLLRKMCCNVDIECLPIITVYLICLKMVYICLFLLIVGRNSSLGMASRYGLDGPGIESRWWRGFQHPSRPALGPSQPPIQWVPGLSRGKLAGELRWPPTTFSTEVKERV